MTAAETPAADTPQATWTVFVGERRLATDRPETVARLVRDLGTAAMPLVFDDVAGRVVDVDLREDAGSPAAAPALSEAAAAPARGRPKLGVVAREVTLLPRHWDWLSAQPGGASVALRKLVDAARKSGEFAEIARRATESAGRFLAAVAGDRPGYEEATRALYAGDRARFEAAVADFPPDVRDHACALLRGRHAG